MRLFMRRYCLLLVAAAFTVLSCDKEDRKNTYANQEAAIDSYVAGFSVENRVVYRKGSVRVVIQEGTSVDTLKRGDSLYFYFSGYTFNYGRGSLFATNVKEVAEAADFYTDGLPKKIKYGSDAMIEGLKNGLEGMRVGENSYIMFSGKYGYGNQIMFNIPKMTPLFFDITIDKIIKNDK